MTHTNHTNQKWYPHKERGSYYRLNEGVLYQCPMMADGSRSSDDEACSVAWESIEDDQVRDCERIRAELALRP